ncbi:alginate O-acetyltransferase AlgX-related protein [Oscillibacter sp.]|uniref:alginate O-acetyltransferase AlgX-related protein n=1 Tax=Oscillibacter sp. TaxID=1945593 RepID=UPI002D7EFDA4|nr:hypothetical protein [Oscillibacter sp.]
MKKNVFYAAFTALILLLCLIPSLGMLLPKEEGAAGGNQALSRAPSLRDAEGNWNSNYLSQVQDYAGDNFHLRQEMITAWSALNAKALGSSITEDVVLGSDGWLYFADTLPDYVGLSPMSDREIFSAARNLALISEYCEDQGAAFLFTVAPNKNSLYWANMPDLTLPAARKPRDAKRLAEELERQGVEYLDCFALFREQEETLYFKTDSHWNGKGAALAADGVNEALGRSSSYFEGPFISQEVHKGDLYDMLYPAGDGLEADPVYGGELAIEYDVPIRSAENLTIMTHGGGEGSLVMFRDSFGNNLYPYLADSFGTALFSRSMPYRLDLAAQREADCVAAELVERNLRYLIQNVPVMPAPGRGTEKPEGFTVYGSGVNFDVEPSEDLPGYALATCSAILQGRDPLYPDSPVYVSASDGNYYEAFLLEDGAAGLYLPEGVRPLGLAYRGPKAPGL